MERRYQAMGRFPVQISAERFNTLVSQQRQFNDIMNWDWIHRLFWINKVVTGSKVFSKTGIGLTTDDVQVSVHFSILVKCKNYLLDYQKIICMLVWFSLNQPSNTTERLLIKSGNSRQWQRSGHDKSYFFMDLKGQLLTSSSRNSNCEDTNVQSCTMDQEHFQQGKKVNSMHRASG